MPSSGSLTAPATATSTPKAKISVPITFTCGGTLPPLRWKAPYTHSGKVCVEPLLKLVMM